MILPTYWFIDPIYQIALKGAVLADVWGELGVALGIAALLAVSVVLLSKRLRTQLAAT